MSHLNDPEARKDTIDRGPQDQWSSIPGNNLKAYYAAYNSTPAEHEKTLQFFKFAKDTGDQRAVDGIKQRLITTNDNKLTTELFSALLEELVELKRSHDLLQLPKNTTLDKLKS